ncbi:AfsR/SARP family transcriptional regulator [Micromonospora endolithica]|uniref:Transcriptional regulator n=1 Tax=Micromonospora endolithica TaxID=230091 RepID=A0A3A9YS96_9ACTN|nr:AfsR/SARP family transcriptional regulator [Micromonospora endolithica]RKN38870.1 transcriptional regulator [Micromonospora endolithica]TWJ25495.1 DNA-binding SARP family transcriptional activator [Micromonospora endolithica]
MRFGILGPLRVGGGEATVTAGRDRTVLAMLLLRHGRIVPADELVDAIWAERPPVTARTQLQICVSRLRQRLTTLGLSADMIVTDPGGYGIRVDDDDLDAMVFRRHVDDARAALAAGRPDHARGRYRAALELWRGPALSGITSDTVRRRAQTLDEQRLTALEEYVDVELRLGHAADLLDELHESVERHPLRERLRAQLMLALTTVGRQAAALTVYREGRRLYAEELGIEPGAALQELHQRVLAGDLAMAGAPRATAAPVRGLPRAISDFTGRQDTVARLLKEIEEDDARIQLIDGMPGSGKTTLAVHLAARLADRYPDAQLIIDLHGHSDREPLSPAAALAVLLRQLGVPSDRIPPDVDERTILWRSELADRHAIVVLDNAATADQVVPLLPSGRRCLTLITSRRRLIGLDEGRPSSLPVLDPDEAVELLARVAGRERVAAEPAGAAEVVRRCGYLPLAIRLAGARLAHRSRWRIADLAERLSVGGDPLAELAAGERSVGHAFALSYAQLSAGAQRMFRLLGLHPGQRIDNRVAAALADLPLTFAQDLLDELVDAHLVEEPDPGRYRFHDLVRDYARYLLAEPAVAADRDAALDRMLNTYLHVVGRIGSLVDRSASRASFEPPPVDRPDVVEAIVAHGVDWLDERRATLTGLVGLAEREGRLAECWQLVRAGWSYWLASGQIDDLVTVHRTGLRAAERLGDDAAIATMHNYLASGYYRLGRHREALASMDVALRLRERLGDRLAQAGSHKNMAIVLATSGDIRASLASLEKALVLLRRERHDHGIVALYTNQSAILLMAGRPAEALALSRRQLAMGRALGELSYVVIAMGHIGMARARLGEHGPARRRLTVALTLKRRLGNRYGVGELLNELGAIELSTGHPQAAVDLHREALITMTEVGDRQGQCVSRNLLARALRVAGDPTSACDLHHRALADAVRLNFRGEQARAHDGIARCLRDSDPAAARGHWSRALALFRQLPAPEADEVERLLADLD